MEFGKERVGTIGTEGKGIEERREAMEFKKV